MTSKDLFERTITKVTVVERNQKPYHVFYDDNGKLVTDDQDMVKYLQNKKVRIKSTDYGIESPREFLIGLVLEGNVYHQVTCEFADEQKK